MGLEPLLPTAITAELPRTQATDDSDTAYPGSGDSLTWPGKLANRASERKPDRLHGEQSRIVDRHHPREEVLWSGLPDESVKA